MLLKQPSLANDTAANVRCILCQQWRRTALVSPDPVDCSLLALSWISNLASPE